MEIRKIITPYFIYPAAIVLCMLSLMQPTTARATEAVSVETLLEQFDRQQDTDRANRFFEKLAEESFTDETILFSAATPADSLRQQVWFWAAEWFYDQQQFRQAERYALQSLELCKYANGDKADCLNTLGCIYVRMGDFTSAANYSKQSVEIESHLGDHDRISSGLNTLAGIYMAANQPHEAEHYIRQALEHAAQADNRGRKAILLGMASEIYHALGNDTLALSYAEQAYDQEEQLERPHKMMVRLSQKASALIGLHRYDEAETTLQSVIPALREMGDYHSLAIAENKMGMALLCQERQREAITYYREAARLFSQMGDLYNEIHAHRGLFESYWQLNPDSARLELEYFDLLKDSLYTHATADALSRYNAEFGNLQLEQENRSVRNAHQRDIIIAVVLIVLIALAAWFVIRRNHRHYQQQAQQLISQIKSLSSDHTIVAQGNADGQRQAEKEGAEPQPDTGTDENRQFLMKVIEAVNQGLPTGQYNVENIASALNMSVQTFRRRLMSAAGESPKSYISAIQMERATILLTNHPTMPVAQVARQCGFDESSSFGHTFKRVYGCSPTQYRENNSNK